MRDPIGDQLGDNKPGIVAQFRAPLARERRPSSFAVGPLAALAGAAAHTGDGCTDMTATLPAACPARTTHGG